MTKCISKRLPFAQSKLHHRAEEELERWKAKPRR
jgi:hypothetical protein